MWLVILLFLLLYWLLYRSPPFLIKTLSKVDKEEEEEEGLVLSSLQPSSTRPPPPYTYFFEQAKEDGQLTLSASYGGSWNFSINEDYIFDRYQISESDACSGKPNGFIMKVRGKALYDTILKKKLFPSSSSSLIAYDAMEYIRRGYDFYFQCDHDIVRQLYACPPGGGNSSFRKDDCHAIDSCIDRENGFVLADPTDRTYYRVCVDEKPVRKRCQPDTFFWMDACRPLVSNALFSEMCESEHFVIPIHKKKYIRCVVEEEENSNGGGPKYRGVIEECPENTSILGSWKSCKRDDCVGVPNEIRKPMTAVTREPFVYSPGYYVCRENRIAETVKCPTEWHPGTSRGDNLTQLPTVFDAKRQTCSVPSFCENVFSVPGKETVVPVHEFTKRVSKWTYAAFFDSVAGFRCEEKKKIRFALEPGKRIMGNAVVSACGGLDSRTKIPIGDRIDAYYDCESQSVIECDGPDSIFDGERCRKIIKNAHSYKNIPFFRLTGLSHLNDWLEPFPSRPNSSNCMNEQENVIYFSDYDVCSVPECNAYPFLKQMPKDMYFFLPDGKHICTYNSISNTIRRKRHFFGPSRKLDFWNQRSVPRTDDSESDCEFGQNMESGNFFLDNTIFVTCNEKQPFVFCPAASTRGIALGGPYDTYACVPRDSAYEIHVDANETISCLTKQVEYFQIEEESHYLVNGKEELGSEFRNPSSGFRNVFPLTEENFTFWSDRSYVVRYRKLPTYPPNVHLEKNSLASGTLSLSNNWLIPIDLPKHIVEESINKNELY